MRRQGAAARLALVAALVAPAPAVGQVVPVEVVRVIDGDTVVVDAHPWPGVTIRTSVRVDGVDTPELRGRCPEERAAAERALQAVIRILSRAAAVTVIDPRDGTYAGRVVARVEVDGTPLTATLIAGGYGRPYDGRTRRQPWCQEPG